MVEKPLDSSVPFVYTCLDCGVRFGAADLSEQEQSDVTACPRCEGPLRQQHRL